MNGTKVSRRAASERGVGLGLRRLAVGELDPRLRIRLNVNVLLGEPIAKIAGPLLPVRRHIGGVIYDGSGRRFKIRTSTAFAGTRLRTSAVSNVVVRWPGGSSRSLPLARWIGPASKRRPVRALREETESNQFNP